MSSCLVVLSAFKPALFSTATSQRLPVYKVCEPGAAGAAQREASAFIHQSRD